MIGNNPAHLVRFAVGPEQFADLPHVVPPSAMGAAGKFPAPMQRKWNDIVIVMSHDQMVGQHPVPDCDRALIDCVADKQCDNNENQVRPTGMIATVEWQEYLRRKPRLGGKT